MNLVPVPINFSDVEIEEQESEASLEGKISQMEQHRSILRKRLEECTECCKRGSTILASSKNFCDLEKRHFELMEELQRREATRLKAEMERNQDPAFQEQAKDILARLAELNDAPEKAPTATERVRTTDKELKRMYKKLMNAIHPDRVKNKRLNDLVPLVTSLYDRGDYYAMSEIYETVCKSTGSIKSMRERARKFLVSLLESLKNDLMSLNSKIQDNESMLSHHVYHIAQNANEEVAIKFAIQQLNAVVRELENQLYPRQSFTIRTNFGGNTIYF